MCSLCERGKGWRTGIILREPGFNNMNKGADILLLIYNMSALLYDVCRNRLSNSFPIIWSEWERLFADWDRFKFCVNSKNWHKILLIVILRAETRFWFSALSALYFFKILGKSYVLKNYSLFIWIFHKFFRYSHRFSFPAP